jgi:hypothetical protein
MLKGISNYKQTYQYQELLKEHNLSEYGIWEVRGEDPNCDLGGHHSQPFLGHFEGTLEDVLNIAVDLPNFWQWGAGGTIKQIKSKPVLKLNEYIKHKQELDETEQQILRLQDKVKQLKIKMGIS